MSAGIQVVAGRSSLGFLMKCTTKESERIKANGKAWASGTPNCESDILFLEHKNAVWPCWVSLGRGKMTWRVAMGPFSGQSPDPKAEQVWGARNLMEPEANRYVHHRSETFLQSEQCRKMRASEEKPAKCTVCEAAGWSPRHAGACGGGKMEMEPGSRYRYGSRATFYFIDFYWVKSA